MADFSTPKTPLSVDHRTHQQASPLSRLNDNSQKSFATDGMSKTRFRTVKQDPDGHRKLGPVSAKDLSTEDGNGNSEDKSMDKSRACLHCQTTGPSHLLEASPRPTGTACTCTTPPRPCTGESLHDRQARQRSKSFDGLASPRRILAHKYMAGHVCWDDPPEMVAQTVVKLITHPNFYKSNELGMIYALYDSELGLVKIGRTGKTASIRSRDISRACNIEGGLLQLKDPENVLVNDVQRLERLIHADLAPHRWVYRCACGKDSNKGYTEHEEWFEVPNEYAIKTIQFWRNFVRQEPWMTPYLKGANMLKKQWRTLLDENEVEYGEETHNDHHIRLNRWRKLLGFACETVTNNGPNQTPVKTEITTKVKNEIMTKVKTESRSESALKSVPVHPLSTPTIAIEQCYETEEPYSESEEHSPESSPSPSPLSNPATDLPCRGDEPAQPSTLERKLFSSEMQKTSPGSHSTGISPQAQASTRNPFEFTFAASVQPAKIHEPSTSIGQPFQLQATGSSNLANNAGKVRDESPSYSEGPHHTGGSRHNVVDKTALRPEPANPTISQSTGFDPHDSSPADEKSSPAPDLERELLSPHTTIFPDPNTGMSLVLRLAATFLNQKAGSLPPRTIATDLQQLRWPLACSLICALSSPHIPALLSFLIWSVFLPFFVAELRDWDLSGHGDSML